MEQGTLTREELMTYRDAKAEDLKARWAIEKEKDRERIKTQLREALAIREAPTTRQAACRDRDLLDVFFSEAPGAIAQAKSICAECPIRESCLQGALERREPGGIWGGELIRNGHSPRDAAGEVLRRIIAHTPPRLLDDQGRPTYNLTYYVLAADGRHAGVSLWGPTPYAVTDDQGTRFYLGEL